MAQNKVSITIAGINLLISTAEDEEYVLQLAKEIDDYISAVLDKTPGASVTNAVLLCTLEYYDEYKKATRTANHMRSQIKDYMAEAAGAKLQFDEETQKTAALEGEIQTLRNHLTRIAAEGDASGVMEKLREDAAHAQAIISRLRKQNEDLTEQNKALNEKSDAMSNYIADQDREITRLTSVTVEMAGRLNEGGEMSDRLREYESEVASLINETDRLKQELDRLDRLVRSEPSAPPPLSDETDALGADAPADDPEPADTAQADFTFAVDEEPISGTFTGVAFPSGGFDAPSSGVFADMQGEEVFEELPGQIDFSFSLVDESDAGTHSQDDAPKPEPGAQESPFDAFYAPIQTPTVGEVPPPDDTDAPQTPAGELPLQPPVDYLMPPEQEDSPALSIESLVETVDSSLADTGYVPEPDTDRAARAAGYEAGDYLDVPAFMDRTVKQAAERTEKPAADTENPQPTDNAGQPSEPAAPPRQPKKYDRITAFDIDISDLPNVEKNTPEPPKNGDIFSGFEIEKDDTILGFSSIPRDRELEDAEYRRMKESGSARDKTPEQTLREAPLASEHAPDAAESVLEKVQQISSSLEKAKDSAPDAPTPGQPTARDAAPDGGADRKKKKPRGGRLESFLGGSDDNDMPDLDWTLDI